MPLSFSLRLVTGLIRCDPTAFNRAASGPKNGGGSFAVTTSTGLLLEMGGKPYVEIAFTLLTLLRSQ